MRDAPIINVGGGASVPVDYLCAEGYVNVAVLDISASALASARRRRGDKAARVGWLDEDMTRFHSLHGFRSGTSGQGLTGMVVICQRRPVAGNRTTIMHRNRPLVIAGGPGAYQFNV